MKKVISITVLIIIRLSEYAQDTSNVYYVKGKKINKFIPLLLIFFIISGCQAQSIKSIKSTLVETSYDNIDDAIVHYHKLKKEQPKAFNFNDEYELNNLGYQLINDDRIEDAIKIFKLLVSEFPNSANPYDSLGEAYSLSGNTELAIENYKKSLALNPKNENAERFILNKLFENRDKNKFQKVFERRQYVDDLDELVKKLTTINPHPYKFMSKDNFWRVVEEKKSLLTDKTTYSEFIWHCSELVANINCGHSAIPMYFNQESEMLPANLRFPMELFNIDGKLYVADTLINNNKVKSGAEILTINGKNFTEIIADINKHISSQGNVGNASKRHLFNWQSSAMIPYSFGFPENYEIAIKGKREPIALDMLETYQFQLKNLNSCKETFCLDFIDNNERTAIMTINHWDFYGNRFSILREFIDDSFKRINDKNSENLIIDVRGNGGGNSWGASHLLQYLIETPFTYFKAAPANDAKLKPLSPFDNRFKGDVYFLTDGRAGSTTGQLLALAKHHKIGIIVGEESNGGIFYTGGQKIFRLKNTGVFYLVGRVTHVTNADSISIESGVLPHHYSVQTIEDYLKEIDTAKEFTLKLIESK